MVCRDGGHSHLLACLPSCLPLTSPGCPSLPPLGSGALIKVISLGCLSFPIREIGIAKTSLSHLTEKTDGMELRVNLWPYPLFVPLPVSPGSWSTLILAPTLWGPPSLESTCSRHPPGVSTRCSRWPWAHSGPGSEHSSVGSSRSCTGHC